MKREKKGGRRDGEVVRETEERGMEREKGEGGAETGDRENNNIIIICSGSSSPAD